MLSSFRIRSQKKHLATEAHPLSKETHSHAVVIVADRDASPRHRRRFSSRSRHFRHRRHFRSLSLSPFPPCSGRGKELGKAEAFQTIGRGKDWVLDSSHTISSSYRFGVIEVIPKLAKGKQGHEGEYPMILKPLFSDSLLVVLGDLFLALFEDI
nr:hypothetical protein CFP56_75172 [Quercus suber]